MNRILFLLYIFSKFIQYNGLFHNLNIFFHLFKLIDKKYNLSGYPQEMILLSLLLASSHLRTIKSYFKIFIKQPLITKQLSVV